MSECYRSPYEAYPYLCEPTDDLHCDFELLTDEMASLTGALRARVTDPALDDQLGWVCELIYHLNPTLRTHMSVTQAECERLHAAFEQLWRQQGLPAGGFVLPAGCAEACDAHVLRVKAKQLVRLLYRHMQGGHEVPPLLLDVANLLSGYFFAVALALNAAAGEPETPFVSRNYR